MTTGHNVHDGCTPCPRCAEELANPLAELSTWEPPAPADWAADLAARSVALRSWGFKDPTVEALLVAYTRQQ